MRFVDFFLELNKMGACKNITVTLPYGMFRALKTRSERTNLPYSELVRRAIGRFIENPSRECEEKPLDN